MIERVLDLFPDLPGIFSFFVGIVNVKVVKIYFVWADNFPLLLFLKFIDFLFKLFYLFDSPAPLRWQMN